MGVYEVDPRSEFTTMLPEAFETAGVDRLLNVPAQHVLVALGCEGCSNRLCINVDAQGDLGPVLKEIETGISSLGLPATALSKHSKRVVKAECPDECNEYTVLSLEVLAEEARLRAKPKPAVYQPRDRNSWLDTWWD